jgi:hypothetical protein
VILHLSSNIAFTSKSWNWPVYRCLSAGNAIGTAARRQYDGHSALAAVPARSDRARRRLRAMCESSQGELTSRTPKAECSRKTPCSPSSIAWAKGPEIIVNEIKANGVGYRESCSCENMAIDTFRTIYENVAESAGINNLPRLIKTSDLQQNVDEE